MPGVSSLGGNSPPSSPSKSVDFSSAPGLSLWCLKQPWPEGDGLLPFFSKQEKKPVGWSSVTFQWRIQMELKLGFLQPLPDTKVKVIEFYLKEKCEVSYLGSFTCSHVRFNPGKGESSTFRLNVPFWMGFCQSWRSKLVITRLGSKTSRDCWGICWSTPFKELFSCLVELRECEASGQEHP